MQGSRSPQRVLKPGALAAIAMLAMPVAAHAAQPATPAFGQAAGKAGQRAAAAPAAADKAALDRQASLMPAAERAIAKSRSADSALAGVKIDGDAGVLDVYTTDTSKQPDVGDLPAGTTLHVHKAAFSRAAMTAAGDRVKDESRVLSLKKVSVAAVGSNEDGSGISVTVVGNAADAERAAQVLRARYGKVVGSVRAIARQTSDADLFFAGFRFNDFPAWYGGDRLSSSAGGCTSGFAAVYNGAPAMLTAAHCGGVGTAFSNGPRTNGTYSAMGNSVYSDPNTDVAAIGVSSTTNYINVGSDPQVPTQLYVGTWGSPVYGQYLCQSGSYTGERCNLRVVATYQQVCRSWFVGWCTAYTSPLTDVINSAGSGYPAAGHGDSGGPVYLRTGSTATAIGLVHGTLTPNTAAVYPAYGGDTMWCPAPEGWQQRCSSGFSFAHMPGY
jgi:Trypsin